MIDDAIAVVIFIAGFLGWVLFGISLNRIRIIKAEMNGLHEEIRALQFQNRENRKKIDLFEVKHLIQAKAHQDLLEKLNRLDKMWERINLKQDPKDD